MAPVPKKPVPSSAPMLKNASAAPLVYFDNVPLFGVYSGNIEVELSTRYLMPKLSGEVIGEVNCTGHLRCSPQAAAMLINALEKALEIHARQQQDSQADAQEKLRAAQKEKANGATRPPTLNG